MSKARLIKHLLKQHKKKQKSPGIGRGGGRGGGSGDGKDGGGITPTNGKWASDSLKKSSNQPWTSRVPKKNANSVAPKPTKRPAIKASLKSTTSLTKPNSPGFKEVVKTNRKAALSVSKKAGAKMMKQRIVKKSPAKINNVLAKKPRPPKRPKM